MLTHSQSTKPALSCQDLPKSTTPNLTGGGCYIRPDLSHADLSDAGLPFADLSETKGLTQAQLDQEACGGNAKLPPDLTLKPCSWE
jgi:hypothetical protein